MKLVVISPEQSRADEADVVQALFAAGLERYHVRRPHTSAAELERWIEQLPAKWRGRLVLHQHHELVAKLGLGGCHWRDVGAVESHRDAGRPGAAALPGLTSRSCHDLATLRAALGVFDSVFFGPVFPSISKPGYAPQDAHIGDALGAVLLTRSAHERRTAVIAIGGITPQTAPRARELGFDGVAVLGAVWQAADPIAEFARIQAVCRASSGLRQSVAAAVD